MKKFKFIAALIKASRLQAEKSQAQVGMVVFESENRRASEQFISNIERGLCGVPAKNILAMAGALNIAPIRIVDTMVKDNREYLDACLSEQSKETLEQGHNGNI